jgi:hypothetical protein
MSAIMGRLNAFKMQSQMHENYLRTFAVGGIRNMLGTLALEQRYCFLGFPFGSLLVTNLVT